MVARGAGTGLSGGAISQEGGIVIAFSRMNRILEVDVENQRAVVQPGVVNLQLSEHVSHLGLYFAPDPSSQKACTIGGNVAENSGGPHTLMYGVTVNHVTGVEVVLPSGEVVHFGGKAAESYGYDMTGFFVGSEGTIGITTAITVKLLRKPEKVATLLGDLRIGGRCGANGVGDHRRRALLLPRWRCWMDGRCAPSRRTATPVIRWMPGPCC